MDRRVLPAQRFDETINLKINTFGCKEKYSVFTLNISRTGLLTASNTSLPFQVNTLLEMCIDPDTKHFQNPIRCLGKVTRIADESRPEKDKFPSIVGITISDVNDENMEGWSEYVEILENYS